MEKFKLTITNIEALPFAEKGKQVDYYDSTLDGFGVRVSATDKKYFVRAYVNGKRTRVMLGSVKITTWEKARREAKTKIGRMESGVDLNAEKRAKAAADKEAEKERKRQAAEEAALKITLQAALSDYLEDADLKPRTVTTYQDLFRLYLADWLDMSVTEITPDMVKERHASIAKGDRDRPRYISVPKTPEEIEAERREAESRTRTRGQRATVKITLTKRIIDPQPKRREAAADNCMRTLGAVLAYYQEEKNPAFVNPVRTLSKRGKRKTKTGKWFKVDRRTTIIKSSDLPAWHKAAMALENTTMRDYLLFLLFTGARRTEAARLTWKHVDFSERTFTMIDTKNGEAHTLPMSDYLFDLLQARRESAVTGYVFPGGGKTGYIQEPKRAIEDIRDVTGIQFACHDLRRTFETLAESLDLSRYALKSLLNHKQDKRDVTTGYIILTAERLREPMQKITAELLKRIETQHGTVIDFAARKGSKAA